MSMENMSHVLRPVNGKHQIVILIVQIILHSDIKTIKHGFPYKKKNMLDGSFFWSDVLVCCRKCFWHHITDLLVLILPFNINK